MQKLSRRQTLTSILAAGASVAVPPARADGASARVSLLLINDIYRIEEKNGRGGMARFAAVVKAERARALAEDFSSHLCSRWRYAVAELVVELRPGCPHG